MSIPRLTDYPLPQGSDLPANKVAWQPVPQRAALLIHDMQDYFLQFWAPDSALIRQVVNNIARLRDACHQAGIPVFYTAQPENQCAEDRALLNDMWGPGITRYPAQQCITARLAPASQDTVLTKWRYSAFARSDLESRLTAAGRDQLFICGVYAHIGCLTTATDAFMRDIQAFMVADGLADFSEEEHRMALRYTAGRSGCVLDTQQILDALRTETDWTLARLKTLLLPALDEDIDDIDADENLLDYGLDSVRIMSLASHWRQQGHALDFIALVKQPTLNGWLKLLTLPTREHV